MKPSIAAGSVQRSTATMSSSGSIQVRLPPAPRGVPQIEVGRQRCQVVGVVVHVVTVRGLRRAAVPAPVSTGW